MEEACANSGYTASKAPETIRSEEREAVGDDVRKA